MKNPTVPVDVPLASIPSPSQGEIELGPLTLHAYGLMLLLGILAATWLTGLRWRRGSGRPLTDAAAAGRDWELVFRVAMWGVAGGIVGARLYHVVTSWSEVPDAWWGPFAIWKGGLGVWGGIAGGVLTGAVVVRRAGERVFPFMDAVAPGLLLAQAIGRWGNWWNQELFGKPTDRPWGLEIDPENRPVEHLENETFHPVFLYESLYALVMAGVLLALDRRVRIRPPALFALYVAVYCFGRFFFELLRVDEAHELAGLRLNAWVSIVLFVAATAFFVWWQFGRGRKPPQAERHPSRAIPRGRVRSSR